MEVLEFCGGICVFPDTRFRDGKKAGNARIPLRQTITKSVKKGNLGEIYGLYRISFIVQNLESGVDDIAVNMKDIHVT